MYSITIEEKTMSSASQITIYSTTWCAFCKTEKQYLDKLGIEYVEKDIESDKEAYEELMSKNGGAFQGVPVTDIAGDLVLGFDRLKIDSLIKEKGILATAA
jgi:glutaredoxin-like YruB-family protein